MFVNDFIWGECSGLGMFVNDFLLGGMKWSWYVCQRLSFGRNKVVLVCLSTTFFWEEGSGLGIIMCVQLTDHPTTGQAT